MNITSDRRVRAEALRSAWALLDDASQLLVRAEAIVALLGAQSDTQPHHAYGADVASELLQRLKEKMSEAQKLVYASR